MKRAGFNKVQLAKMDSTMTERAEREEEWDQQIKQWISETDVKTLPCDTSAIEIDYFSKSKLPPWVKNTSDLPQEYGLRLVSFCQKGGSYHFFNILMYSCKVWYTDTLDQWQGKAFTERHAKPTSFIQNMPKDIDESKPIRITFFNLYVQNDEGNTLKIRRVWSFEPE